MLQFLLCLFFCSVYVAVPEKNFNNPVQVYALVGTNVSLDSMKTPNINELTKLSWIKQEDNPSKNLQFFLLAKNSVKLPKTKSLFLNIIHWNFLALT